MVLPESLPNGPPIVTASLLLALAFAAMSIPTASAADCPDPSTAPPPRLLSYRYLIDGSTYQTLDGNAHAGDVVTARLVVDGCGAQEFSFAAYDATSDFNLEDQRLNNADTRTVGEGVHELMITVPACFFQLDLVYGPPLDAFNPPDETYSAQSRLIDSSSGGDACATTTTTPTSVPPTESTTGGPVSPTTEIPVFPSPVTLALGAIGGLGGAFLVMRRRT